MRVVQRCLHVPLLILRLISFFPQSLDDASRRKRGRPRKDKLPGSDVDSPIVKTDPSAIPGSAQAPRPLQNPGGPPHGNSAPAQSSPPKATPTKTVVKALPTVRDHTTDQLNPEQDEYIPREIDPDGEKKVTPHGRLTDGREYRCRTFLVPNRGDKLFMLATECARVLTYRDSYLLFNKNRSLYKIIATQQEKDDLIQQEILPYSYRSRQIAIVTAKSMFRQFGSRLIVNGRRVRDDYWEAKARKQGFTEEDLAGEKRPGGAKAAREAAEAANAPLLGHQDIVYSNGPGTIPVDAQGHPQLMQAGLGGPMGTTLAPLPMILPTSDEMRMRGEYGGLPRGPRQEMTGIPYQDRIQPSSHPEMLSQSTHTADFNKAVNAQSKQRNKQFDDFYKQSRDITNPGLLQQTADQASSGAQSLQAGQTTSAGLIGSSQQPMLQHQGSTMMHPPSYQQQQPQAAQQQQPQQAQQAQQQPAASQHHASSQSPVRNMQPQMRPEHMPHHSSSLSYGSSGMPQSSAYGYAQSSQMWGQPPPQPHQSPLSAHHGLPQYQSAQATHGSPHPSQSPHQQHQSQPQLQHPQSSGSMHGGMGYPTMPNMAQGGYGTPSGMYRPGQSSSPHAYMQHSTASGAAGLQTWAPPPQGGHNQSWAGY